MRSSIEKILAAVGVLECGNHSEPQLEAMRANGYDFDKILQSGGYMAEDLHDALFLTEGIARTTLGENYKRVVSSTEKCTDAAKRLPIGARIVDLGGGCGITCFEAAKIRPDIHFIVADRSKNSLAIGSSAVSF